MLIFTETVLRMLPKVWHDVAQVIHFYEAGAGGPGGPGLAFLLGDFRIPGNIQ